jgi:hypothetical protein
MFARLISIHGEAATRAHTISKYSFLAKLETTLEVMTFAKARSKLEWMQRYHQRVARAIRKKQ